jgi:hypothetical protein
MRVGSVRLNERMRGDDIIDLNETQKERRKEKERKRKRKRKKRRRLSKLD